MKMISISVILSLLFMPFAWTAGQSGTVRGTIIDHETGETLIGVNIFIEGSPQGTITDIDGSYSLNMSPGAYQLNFSYISYASKKITDVIIKPDEVTVLDLRLEPESVAIAEVIVTAKAVENTETALLTIQKKSGNLLDGISSQTFSRTGDSDAASAIKRVTGVTVEGGKYVYVRGLGDRYSKSILNSMEIPGLDPERNTVQMDIFPSNVIDNIIVYKTFTPDLPGDFTGGMVDVKTKDFPTRKTISVSGSFSYDAKTHFQDDFILYNGSKADAVSFGKGSRQLDFSKDYEPDLDDAATAFANTNSLNKELDWANKNNFLDQSYSFSFGDQVDRKGETKWGYLGALNYKNTYSFRPDYYQSEIRVISANNEAGYEYEPLTIREGRVGENESLWSAMMSGSVKKNNNKIGLKYLHTQTGERAATANELQDFFNTQDAIETSLSYIQRMISNTILSGEHLMKNRYKVHWGNAFTYTSIDQPDLSSSELVIEDGDTLFTSGSSNVDKIWRELSEINNNAKVDFEIPFDQWAGLETKVKVGASSIIKQRDFETYNVSIGKSTSFSPDLNTITGSLNSILATENLYSPTNDEGYVISNVQVDPENKYKAMQSIMALYAMIELPLAQKLKFIGGLRTEYNIMNYEGTERLSGDPIDERVLDSWQFLPAANFVVFLMDNMNLRTSYSRTLARPSFREKSESIIYDPVEGTTFYGNLDLIETNIHNADLRWEYFFGRGEIFSVSGFFKKFQNPIEVEPLENGGTNNIKPVNRDEADVYGFEVEFRKNLRFIHEKLEGLSIGSNFTYVKSRIGLSDDQKEKYELVGAEVPDNRALMGQSPFVVNATLGYSNIGSGSEVVLTYNVKGKTLMLVGVGALPDVYEDPFHNLDFKFSQKLGKDHRGKISVSAKNLIGDDSKLYHEFLGEEAGIYRGYSRGREFSLGFSYTVK
jgi:TonB-dependent receptor